MANVGSAGTGKTLISCYKAIKEVLSKDNPFSQLVVVRSAVATRDVGHLPGTLEEKTELYELPYVETFRFLFNRHDAWQRLKEQGHCKFLTTTAIRGVTIDDAIILVDESQNMTWEEINTIMTRVGYRSKIIFCGDFKQNDLVKHKNDISGFMKFMTIAKSMPEFSFIEFTTDDILRSSLVKNWIIATEKAEK
jgi:predicted ribonuclease YlaK